MRIFVSFLAILSCFACSNRKNSLPRPFSTEMLATQVFSIDTKKDTSLQTLHGSIIRIASGSFSVSGNVKLEIKEAFTPAEIFAAGLATESNGRLLRSGGMIYINATVNGEKPELLKPIKVSIPNQYYDSSMQIFKGIETDSAGINWVDPSKPDTSDQTVQWLKGKKLFMNWCASCHNIFTPLTGPALKNVEYRGPWTNRTNIHAYLRNPVAFTARSKYVKNLKEQYVVIMPAYPNLPGEDIDAILDYIKNESNNADALIEGETVFPSDSSKDRPVTLPESLQPCNDTIYEALPKASQSFLNLSITAPGNNGNSDIDTLSPLKASEMEGLRYGFNDPNPTSGMYDFEIRTLGWYNVDAYVEGYDGSSNVKLFVQLQVEFDISMHVYLFCPRNKMLSVMNDIRGDKFYFNKINDGIPLFIADRAILFAFGSKNDKIYYGISEFSVQGEQTIEVKIKESSENEIRKALLAKELEGIDLGIEKKEQKIIKRECDELPGAPIDTLK